MQLLTLLPFFAGVTAHRTYQDKIPNGKNVKDCSGQLAGGVGHVRAGGGGNRNVFGLDFKSAGHTWTEELCQKDSDSDGVTNGAELGDPECVWVEGGTPTFDVGITHPGQDCSNLECETGELASKSMVSADNQTLKGCERYEYPTDETIEMLMKPFVVSTEKTTYMMQAFTYTGEAQLAITKFVTVAVHPALVHHLILYRCPEDLSDAYGTPVEKTRMPCKQVMMGWAVGAPPFCTPEGLAFIVDPGEHFLMEIHYDNPSALTGITDTSGMILHGVVNEGSGLDPAGSTIMGALLPIVSVPPSKEVHRQTLHLSSDKMNLPEGMEYEIFAYGHHMHELGRKQWVTAEYENKAQSDPTLDSEIACITNYDFDLQESTLRFKPFILKRGMSITIDCVWDSRSRTHLTLGGDETENEMCIFIAFTNPPLPGRFNQFIDFGPGKFSNVANKVCGCEEGANTDLAFERRVRLALYHGLFMVAAWAFLLPLGSAVPVCWRQSLGEPHWFNLHKTLQLIGVSVTMVAFILAYMSTETGTHFQIIGGIKPADGAYHKVAGLGIVVLALVQAIGGLARPDKPHSPEEEPTTFRKVWLLSHRIIAVLTMVLAIPQMITGARIYGSWSIPGFFSQSVFLFTIVIGWALTIGFGLYGRSGKYGGKSGFEEQKDIEVTEMTS